MIIPITNIEIFNNNEKRSNKILQEDLRSSAYEQMVNVLINNNPGSLYNWTWAQAVGIVQGGGIGTSGNPYVIEGINFTADSYAEYALEIINTDKYFELKSCFFYGNISEQTNGLYLSNVTNGIIHDNDFLYNVEGISAIFCTRNKIFRNDIREGYGPGGGDGDGIILEDSYYNEIHSNNIEHYSDFDYIAGMELIFCNHNQIWNNTINDTGKGLSLINCDNNSLRENFINRTSNNPALELRFSNNNTVYNNTMMRSRLNCGVDLFVSSNNNITLNTFKYNDLHGIHILSDSDNNNITENIIHNNNNTGAYITDLTSGNNSFWKNNFTKNGLHAYDNGMNNNWNISNIGNYWDNYTGYDTNGDGIGETPYTDIGGGAGAIDYHPIVPSNETQSGFWAISPVSIDNDWTWASNQPWCSGSGTFIKPFVIMNVSINAENSSSAFEIKNSDKFFVFNNCTFYNSTNDTTNFGAGFHLDNATHGIITTNNFSNNNGYGISVINSYNNSISGNIVKNNRYHGIYVDPCNNLTISNNFANDNEYCGIYLEDGTNITLYENFANDNNFYGIYLENCSEVIVIENMINDNSQYGIYLNNSDNNIIDGNTFNKNNIGIYLDYSDYNKVQNNVLTGHTIGIKEEANCVGNTFINNLDDSVDVSPPDDPFLLILIIALSVGGISAVSLFGILRIRKSNRIILEKETMIFNLKKQREEITEDDIVLSKEKHFCLVHKGVIKGYAFICPNCGAYYCLKCIEAIKEIENQCWSCQNVLDASKPVKKTDEESEIKAISANDTHTPNIEKKSIIKKETDNIEK
jgi:parallel beta-helix repeat protein